MTPHDHERVTLLCASFPGAEVSDPFGEGHDVWKVGGKIFALFSTTTFGLSVKTASVDAAQTLIAEGVGDKAPYLHKSWIRVPVDLPDAELRDLVTNSYRIIRGGLTKKAQAALGEWDG